MSQLTRREGQNYASSLSEINWVTKHRHWGRSSDTPVKNQVGGSPALSLLCLHLPTPAPTHTQFPSSQAGRGLWGLKSQWQKDTVCRDEQGKQILLSPPFKGSAPPASWFRRAAFLQKIFSLEVFVNVWLQRPLCKPPKGQGSEHKDWMLLLSIFPPCLLSPEPCVPYQLATPNTHLEKRVPCERSVNSWKEHPHLCDQKTFGLHGRALTLPAGWLWTTQVHLWVSITSSPKWWY